MLLVSKNNIIPLLKILFLSTSHRSTRRIRHKIWPQKKRVLEKKKFSNLTELIENKRDNCARQGREGEEIRTWSIVWRRKGWLRSREARQGAFSLAATKRRRFSPPLFLSLSFLFFSLRPPSPPPPPSSWKSLAALTQSYAICVVRGKSDPSQERRPSKKRSPLSVPPLLSLFPTLPLIAVLPRLTSQILRFFPRVTRFRSQNPIPRLNIYCPLRLINDTFLHPATS